MRFTLKPYLIRLYLSSLGVFFLTKLVVRPAIRGWEVPAWIEIVAYSMPNAVEAVVGMTNVAVLILLVRHRYGASWSWLTDRVVWTLTVLIAGTFVLTQEFGVHDLGGNNVTDPWDALASVLGIALMWFLFARFGVAND